MKQLLLPLTPTVRRLQADTQVFPILLGSDGARKGRSSSLLPFRSHKYISQGEPAHIQPQRGLQNGDFSFLVPVMQ